MDNNPFYRGVLSMLLSCSIGVVGCSPQHDSIDSSQQVPGNKVHSMDKSESQQVAQSTIDLEALQKYLHPDAPDRVHLQLCLPSETAAKIVAAMESPTDDLAVAATIWALRTTK